MEFLTQLWLPIVVSAVFVFIVSSIIHMVLPIHKGDIKKMKNEDAVLNALRTAGVEPGAYMFPCAGSMKEMGTPEMTEKLNRGPVGYLTLMPPGGWNMGKSLGFWFLQSLIYGALVAYAAWYGLGPTDDYLAVFRVTGAAALIGYSISHMHDSIWKGARWGVTAKFMFDGLVYALVTAGTFGWLWPGGAAT
jgi:hypothetical protein